MGLPLKISLNQSIWPDGRQRAHTIARPLNKKISPTVGMTSRNIGLTPEQSLNSQHQSIKCDDPVSVSMDSKKLPFINKQDGSPPYMSREISVRKSVNESSEKGSSLTRAFQRQLSFIPDSQRQDPINKLTTRVEQFVIMLEN